MLPTLSDTVKLEHSDSSKTQHRLLTFMFTYTNQNFGRSNLELESTSELL